MSRARVLCAGIRELIRGIRLVPGKMPGIIKEGVKAPGEIEAAEHLWDHRSCAEMVTCSATQYYRVIELSPG
jgi:hypothetical protein